MKNNHKKIGILYVIGQSEYIGGAEKESLYIINNLDRRKFRPIVILPKHGPVEKLFRSSHIHVKVIGQIRAEIFKKIVSELILSRSVNIIHLVTLREFEFKVAAAARVNNIPCVWHMHFVYKNVYPHTSNIQLKKILSCVCLLSEKVIACSNYVRRQFEELGFGDKVITMPNGVDLDYFKNCSGSQRKKFRKKLGIEANDFLVTMAGRFLPQKRHVDFIDAAKIINRALPDVKFIAAGSFAGRRYFLELQNMAGNNVKITGFQKDVAALLHASDLIVMPSTGEGFGLVILEAMACSKPVIAANSGGAAEIITCGENGLLFDPGKPGSLAVSLMRLAGNSTRAIELGRKGRRLVERKFNIRKSIHKLEAIYQRCYLTHSSLRFFS